jgi:hypothetical protein
VLGKGHTPEEALEEANKKGYKDPILTKIPNENRSYLLCSKNKRDGSLYARFCQPMGQTLITILLLR